MIASHSHTCRGDGGHAWLCTLMHCSGEDRHDKTCWDCIRRGTADAPTPIAVARARRCSACGVTHTRDRGSITYRAVSETAAKRIETASETARLAWSTRGMPTGPRYGPVDGARQAPANISYLRDGDSSTRQ